MSVKTPTAEQQAGYDAVYDVIRQAGTDASANALIWRAVQAYADATEAHRQGTA